MKRLLDKVALITGGISGIGRGIAKKFAQEGADLIISDIFLRSPDEIDKSKREFISEMKSFSREALILKVDVTKSDQVQDMVKKSIERFKKIDILVNNAGIMPANALKNIINLRYGK